jgi:hypothetical protein
MLITPLFVGIYWGARQESVEHCADRLRRMLSELSTCDQTVATWYEQARSRKQALARQVNLDSREYLLNLLDRGRNRRDWDRTVIEELGFGIGLWNGRDRARAATMSIDCGSYSERVGNSVVLNLPEDLGDLRRPERMAAVLASVVRAWEPDSGGVMSSAAMEASDYKLQVPFVNWMPYVSKKVAPEFPPMPPPARVQKVDGLGWIIVVQDEPPDVANPEHARNIERVDAALKPTGWNSPVQ